jgi:hypothetical protein
LIYFPNKKLRGSSYIPTPEKYSNSNCGLINIKNNDQKCFKWCMKYHQTQQNKNQQNISFLKKIKDKYNYDGIDFPTTYDDITKFEDQNKVCIFIFEIDDEGGIIKSRNGNTNYIHDDLIYLLLIEDEEQSHYVYIKIFIIF